MTEQRKFRSNYDNDGGMLIPTDWEFSNRLGTKWYKISSKDLSFKNSRIIEEILSDLANEEYDEFQEEMEISKFI